ncbi:MAG TPA: O-antigen ligase family protein, partial [Patescibacteria group bacterium]|nr:O-antigen ligase family protein [Patescibacteria group bacterium]
PPASSFSEKVAGISDLSQGSVQMRFYYWQAAWQEFEQASWGRKLWGYGPDTLGRVFVKHYQKDWGVQESINTYPNRAHNLFFDTLLSFGLIGVLAGLLFFGYILWRTIKYLGDNKEERGERYWLVFTLLITVLIHIGNNLFSFSNVATYVYFYIILAILAILIFPINREIKINISKFSQVAILAALAVFSSIFIVFYNIDLIKADSQYIEARKIMAEQKSNPRKKCIFAIDNINSAIELDPVHNFYREEYIRVSLNCFNNFIFAKPKIKDDLVKEVEAIPEARKDYDLKLYTARVYSLRAAFDPSYYPQAEEVYQDLIEINPYITTPYKELANLKFQKGKNRQAITVLKEGLDKIPLLDASYSSQEHKREVEIERNNFTNILEKISKVQQKK